MKGITVSLLLLVSTIASGTLGLTVFDTAYDFLQAKADDLLLQEELLPRELQNDFHRLINAVQANNTTNGTDRPVCDTCLNFMRLVKVAAAAYEWEEVRDPVVELCVVIMGPEINTDILCPGAVDNQGPHVFEVAKPTYRNSADDICLKLNACLPPVNNNKPYVNGREKRESVRRHSFGDGWLHDIAPLFSFGHEKRPQSLEERKKEAITVVQFADIHIEPAYAEGSNTDCGLYVCCQDDYGVGDSGAYGDYNCNIPERTMELFLHRAKEMQPDFLLYSGDTPPHTFWEETLQSQLNCSGILTEAIQRILPGYSVYPNLGNHEMYPTNLYSMKYLPNYTAPMNEDFINMWMPLANFTADSVLTFRQGGYYSQLIKPGLRLISFNTNYWYTMNWYNILHVDEANNEIDDMLAFIRQSFEQARQDGDKVLVMGHHPPGLPESVIVYTRLWEEMLEEFSDLIVMHIAGHTHYDEVKLHVNAEGSALGVTFVGPSMTTKTNKNPSMRVFYLDAATHQLIDYEQYGFNLEDVIKNAHAEPVIDLLYSAMTAYGLTDMSPTSWYDFSQRMEYYQESFDAYYQNYVTGYRHAQCDMYCQRDVVCKTRFYSYDDYVTCILEEPVMPSTTVATGSSANQITTSAVCAAITFMVASLMACFQ